MRATTRIFSPVRCIPSGRPALGELTACGALVSVTSGTNRPARAVQRGAETAPLPARYAGLVKLAALFHFRLDLSLVAVDRITREVVWGTL
jgi:hypothetical protein